MSYCRNRSSQQSCSLVVVAAAIYWMLLTTCTVPLIIPSTTTTTTTTTTTSLYCFGFTSNFVPQQKRRTHANNNHHFQRKHVHCSSSSSGVLTAKGTDGSVTVAATTNMNSIITLDGQEIRQEIAAMNNILFVKVKDAMSTTLGGIVLPDQSKQRPTEGIVIASGPGKIHPHSGQRIINPIAIGMNVVYGQYDGKAVMYNDEECQIIRDDNVLLAYPGGGSNTIMTIENVIPIRDYVLVELVSSTQNNDSSSSSSSSSTTNSGIVIAASVLKDDAPCEGRVVKVGEGRMLPDGKSFSKSPVQINDRVKFKEYAGNDIMISGKEYSVVKMVDILCTYKEEMK